MGDNGQSGLAVVKEKFYAFTLSSTQWAAMIDVLNAYAELGNLFDKSNTSHPKITAAYISNCLQSREPQVRHVQKAMAELKKQIIMYEKQEGLRT